MREFVANPIPQVMAASDPTNSATVVSSSWWQGRVPISWRVLQVESDELVDEVRANNVPVEYVLFEDEGHGFRKRVNRITASEAYLSFLKAHL